MTGQISRKLEDHLDLLGDDQLKNYLDQISSERVLQLSQQMKGLAKRFLGLCNANHTKVLFSKIVSEKSNRYREFCEAVTVLNHPDRLPVFVEAVILSRDSFFDRVDVEVLERDDFLPINIRKVVQIEKEFYFYRRNHLEKQKKAAAECNDRLMKLLQEAKARSCHLE